MDMLKVYRSTQNPTSGGEARLLTKGCWEIFVACALEQVTSAWLLSMVNDMTYLRATWGVALSTRADECYANGCPSVVPLPDNPLDIEPPPETIENVKAEATAAVNCLKDAAVVRSTACFLPGANLKDKQKSTIGSDDSLPVIGQVPKVENAYIGCGGGCWGILNGPAMGHCLASLVL
eukprot:3087583-Amphidinium_carterae.1